MIVLTNNGAIIINMQTQSKPTQTVKSKALTRLRSMEQSVEPRSIWQRIKILQMINLRMIASQCIKDMQMRTQTQNKNFAGIQLAQDNLIMLS